MTTNRWSPDTVATIEQLRDLQHRAGIPQLPTQLTYEARLAVCGEGPRGYDWGDKPHRIVYSLCLEIERLASVAQTCAWQPIETAPKDGTLVLITGIGTKGWFISDAVWDGEWLLFHPDDDAHTAPCLAASHWIHLPAFPSPVSSTADEQDRSPDPELNPPEDIGETAQEPIAWVGIHPTGGICFGTIAETQQGATARLMMTGIAGNHDWSVIPLYSVSSTGSQVVAKTQDERMEDEMKLAWNVRKSTIEECAKIAEQSDGLAIMRANVARDIRALSTVSSTQGNDVEKTSEGQS